MNRYTLKGVVADAALGKRVAYVGRRPHVWFNDLAAEAQDAYPDKVARVIHANGRERVEFVEGGRITFHATERAGRGVTADVVVLDAQASHDPETVMSAEVMVASTHGEVIRA